MWGQIRIFQHFRGDGRERFVVNLFNLAPFFSDSGRDTVMGFNCLPELLRGQVPQVFKRSPLLEIHMQLNHARQCAHDIAHSALKALLACVVAIGLDKPSLRSFRLFIQRAVQLVLRSLKPPDNLLDQLLRVQFRDRHQPTRIEQHHAVTPARVWKG